MAEVSVASLQLLATAALHGQGLSADAAREIAEEFVIADVAGVHTHGVGKIVTMNFGDPAADPTFAEKGAVLRVNGNGSSGFLLMRKVADRLEKIARKLGVGLASVQNFSRYSSLYPYTDSLATAGFVGVLMNSAGPAAVAPYGSADPVTGTNPLCVSFPTATGVQTFDFATAAMVWGEIRQAAFENRALPSGPFLDAAGQVTTAPADVNAVKAFGAAKGWSLNLAIEIIAGLLTGGAAGLDVGIEYDCGAVMLAIDPVATGAGTAFPSLVSSLFDDIRNSRPLAPGAPVRVPGDKGRSRIVLDDVGRQVLTVPDTTLALLARMANGEKISELSSNPLFN
jgi:LDH2 family malate/lactate/ureidoglycolate dehydrogenase